MFTKNKKRIIKYIAAWIPSICIMVIIFRFSASVADDSSKTSISLLEIVIDIVKQLTGKNIVEGSATYGFIHHIVRKMGHFLEYMALGCTLVLPFAVIFIESNIIRFQNIKIFLCSELFAALYACTDEFHQLFVEGRDGNIVDVGIDSMGALVGICVGFAFWWIIKRQKQKSISC